MRERESKMQAGSAGSMGNPRAIARVAPTLVALALLAMALGTTGGCGNTFGFGNFSSASATPTSSPGTGAFLYASNYNDGRIAEFARNTSTGALTLKGTVTAGASQGPRGLAIDPSNSYLYAANYADGYVYEFSIRANGALSSIGKVASGTNPEAIAITPNGQYVYVTNFNRGTNGTVSEYSIGSSGTLSKIGTVTGLAGPLGVAVTPDGSYLYVADNTAGVIWSFVINSNGTLTLNGAATPSLGTTTGTPEFEAVASDSSGEYLFVTDFSTGAVSGFVVSSGTLIFAGTFTTGSVTNQPLGIGLALASGNYYLFTANSAGNSVSAFGRLAANLTLFKAVAGPNAPAGLAVDPQSVYVYTADSGDGTVAQMQINGSCGQVLCAVGTFNSESPANSNAGTGFVVMTN